MNPRSFLYFVVFLLTFFLAGSAIDIKSGGGGGGSIPDPLLVSDGTIANPSIAAASSTGTGISFSAGNNMSFSSGGGQKMIVGPSEVTINNDLRPLTAGTRFNGTTSLEWFQTNTRSLQNPQAGTPLDIPDVEGVRFVANTATSGTAPFVRFPSAVSVTPAAKPSCAANSDIGNATVFDDTDDALATDFCYCSRSSAGVFSWVRVSDPAAACTL